METSCCTDFKSIGKIKYSINGVWTTSKSLTKKIKLDSSLPPHK